MLILFDQGTPVGIRHSLSEHTVKTAREMGWSALSNGELLRAAEEAGFDLLLTTDTNLPYQQDLKGRRVPQASLLRLGNCGWQRRSCRPSPRRSTSSSGPASRHPSAPPFPAARYHFAAFLTI